MLGIICMNSLFALLGKNPYNSIRINKEFDYFSQNTEGLEVNFPSRNFQARFGQDIFSALGINNGEPGILSILLSVEN